MQMVEEFKVKMAMETQKQLGTRVLEVIADANERMLNGMFHLKPLPFPRANH